MSFWTGRPQLQNFLSELGRREVRHIQAHHKPSAPRPASRAPSTRDSEARGDRHIAAAVYEIPKAVVVALLRAGRRRHGHDPPSFHHARSSRRGRGRVRAYVTTSRA